MTSSTDSEDTLPPTRSRGQPGLGAACDGCRRRKLRCDRVKPQCGFCQESRSTCEVTERGVRGPKKGYLKALKNRLAHVEALLGSRVNDLQQQPEQETANNDITLPTPPVEDASDSAAFDQRHSWLEAPDSLSSGPETLVSNSALLNVNPFPEWTLPSLSNAPSYVTGPVHSELDQLYFDRVHSLLPILHQCRYLTWSKRDTKTLSQACLQRALWALTTLLSSQFRNMTEPLYRETKQMLEMLDIEGGGKEGGDTALVQAWVSVATCESMRANHRQAWMSAGRAFRLVQAWRFHEIDRPKASGGTMSEPSAKPCDPIEMEERRRVFWMTYFLDHLLSMRNDWPITLNEHIICTRLPASDVDFQRGEFELGRLLSEAMLEPSPKIMSAFNECIILVTICGRSLFQVQQQKISKVYGQSGSNWPEQRQWLENILSARLQVLSKFYPPATTSYDPLLIFANILGQSAVIYNCKGVMESAIDSGMDLTEYISRASDAALATIQLAKALSQLHFSKIHPLMPMPLFLCAEFLYEYQVEYPTLRSSLQELVRVFGELQNVNNQEETYLDLLPQSCVSKTMKMLSPEADNPQGLE